MSNTSTHRRTTTTDNTIYADGVHPIHIATLIISVCIGIILAITMFFPGAGAKGTKDTTRNEAIAGYVDDMSAATLKDAIDNARVVEYAPDTPKVEIEIVDHASTSAIDTHRDANTLGYVYDTPGGIAHGGKLIAVIEHIDCRDLVIDRFEASRGIISTVTHIDGVAWNQVNPVSVHHFAYENANPSPKDAPIVGWVENNGVCY